MHIALYKEPSAEMLLTRLSTNTHFEGGFERLLTMIGVSLSIK